MKRVGSSLPRYRFGRTRVIAVASIATAALFVVVGARRPAPLQAATRHGPDSLTFAADVAPILYRNCVMCHRPGGIGPFSMLNFDTITGRLKDIKDVLSEGKMPPWHAVVPAGTFRNERRLPDTDKRTILRWIANGAPLGDPARMPAEPSFPDGWQIGTPDAVFTMQEDFYVPARGTIEYMYFEVPTNFTEDKWVQAIEIMRGARDVVHHVLVFAGTPNEQMLTAASPNAARQAGAARLKPVLSFDSK